MRINRYVAQATGLSRRLADAAVASGRVDIDGRRAEVGQTVEPSQSILLDGNEIKPGQTQSVILNKPVGYVTSRRQQGKSPTIYELLPTELHGLKPAGRLDKDSSGLLVLTSDGQFAQQVQHPSAGKWKTYYIELDRSLSKAQLDQLERGVELEDGISRMQVKKLGGGYEVRLQEGRNRQIRRTIKRLGRQVTKLHRTSIGNLGLSDLKSGRWRYIDTKGKSV